MSATHPSCIKIPGSKESSQHLQNSSIRDPDIRDHISTKNDLITMANETFGCNKWSHAVTSQTLDFVEYVTGKYHVGCAAFVKVQLSDGSFHEEMGYSNSEGANKGLVIFSARTGSITNALKNTLLCFGGEIATKIKISLKSKTEDLTSAPSIIADSKRFVQPRIAIVPQAQSTPQKNTEKSVSLETKKEAIPVVNIEEIKPAQSNGKAQIAKPVLTEEEKRLARKRRQAQKQEEFKRLREKEAAEKPNARF